MGILDTFSPVEYLPRKVKFLIFILLIVIISPFINSLLLAGKGTVVCDSQRVPYVITGLDYNDLSSSGYLNAYFQNAPDWILQKNKEKWIKDKIERARYFYATGQDNYVVKLQLDYKEVGGVSSRDCVKCSLGNYTNCYDNVTETWSDMELVPPEDYPFYLNYYYICGGGWYGEKSVQDYDERLEITLVSDMNEDYWAGSITNIGLSDFTIDDLIHSTGVKYSVKYESDADDIVPDLMPISCDRNFNPTITILGIPIFNPSTWIFFTLLYLLFLWNSWARQQKNYGSKN